ncbi:MAG: hypothetical protein U0559_16220 [Anaerolineae bacterium]
MTAFDRFIRLETQSGEPMTRGTLTVTPQSQALSVDLRFFRFVWNRPIGVIVDRGGQPEHMPVVDVTRFATWGLIGVSLVFSVIITMAVRRKESHHE